MHVPGVRRLQKDCNDGSHFSGPDSVAFPNRNQFRIYLTKKKSPKWVILRGPGNLPGRNFFGEPVSLTELSDLRAVHV
jgi:hypothetical protein